MLYRDYSRPAGEWLPNAQGGRENLEAISLLKRVNEVVGSHSPGAIMAAEESTAFPGVTTPTYAGGLGFHYKWNMGWMNDTLRYFAQNPIYRRYHQGVLTFSMLYAFSEHFVLVFSHDEVVHGKRSLLEKMPGDDWQKFANLRLLFGYQWAHPGRKLLFQGGEFAQRREWSHERSLDWHLTQSPAHAGVSQCVRDLNHLLRSHRALYELDDSYDGYEWVDFTDSDNSVITFLRKAKNDPTGAETIVVALNFTPVVRHGYRVGFPAEGVYAEVLNTDAAVYGGSNVGNNGEVRSEAQPWGSCPCSAAIELPPLAMVAFKRRAD